MNMDIKKNRAVDIISEVEQCKQDIYFYALEREKNLTGKSEVEIREYLITVLQVMKAAIAKGLDPMIETKGKIIDNNGMKLAEYATSHISVSGKTMRKAISYALAMMEVNASMGKIVASPTAGSCGVLPAVLLTIQERFNIEDEMVYRGLLVANLVGEIIAHHATLSGAQGGCQAEVGSASAMASASVVYMLNGSQQQIFDAAAMCLKNLMGLVCDPIAGLVESPCAKRNTIGAANALICAEMALADIPSIVPFDEVVDAMFRVGKALPPSLKETSQGGLATTATGKALNDKIFGRCSIQKNEG